MEEEILEIGSDVNKKWQFVNGDLVLVKQKENLIQSIYNRLNTNYNSLDIYYDDYGSFLNYFLGWRRNKETLHFMELEIANTLLQDPRLQNVEVELSYGENGLINGYVYLKITEETDLKLSLVLSNTNIEVEEEEEEYGD